MGKISSSDAPIVFKGAMITQLILSEQGFDRVLRITKDVDSNWIGSPPSMDVLVDSINDSLGDLSDVCMAKGIRPYNDRQSAGISIVDRATREQLFSMDISVKPVVNSRTYYVGDVGIKGVLPSEVLADKISVMSTDKIFSKTKHMLDVYALSHCVDVQTKEIFGICHIKGERNNIEHFDAFYNRKSDLEHAYNMLKGVTGKPDFDTIHTYMTKFVQPFSSKDFVNKTWDSDTQGWVQESRYLSHSRENADLSAARNADKEPIAIQNTMEGYMRDISAMRENDKGGDKGGDTVKNVNNGRNIKGKGDR